MARKPNGYAKELDDGEGYFVRLTTENHLDDLVCRTEDVGHALQQYKQTHGLTTMEMARELGEDDSYLRRMMYARGSNRRIVSFYIVDRVFTRLDLPIPPLYIRAWIKVED